MSDQDIQDLQHELDGIYSPFLGDDPAYTDATYTQQSAIYLINNSFSDALLEHNPQFESVNGYEHGEGCQSEKFITFKDNATLSRMPLRISGGSTTRTRAKILAIIDASSSFPQPTLSIIT